MVGLLDDEALTRADLERLQAALDRRLQADRASKRKNRNG
jgi:hypothetical protein